MCEQVKTYIKSQKRAVDENLKNFNYFVTSWKKYMDSRDLPRSRTDSLHGTCPRYFDVEKRDIFQRKISFSGVGWYDQMFSVS